MVRTRRRLVTGALIIVFQMLMAGTAMAHWPNIRAGATCVNGIAVISYTSTSWSSKKGEGENPRIDILFDNVLVGSGAYKSPGYSFSGSAFAPVASTAVVTALAVGTWGDGEPGGQSAAMTVDIPSGCGELSLGRFTGGGSQIQVGGARITRGLTVHCDLLLSNNLEVNWKGHSFHMAEHISTAQCSDDPNIIEAPPEAPLDTMIGVGTGRYDNVDGFTIEFTFVDAGEPGTLDMAALRVFETANPTNVVLLVPRQYLSGGNLQAHFDQPHK